MQIGVYSDGRSLDYDEATQRFSVGGTPVSIQQVIGYDRAGQLTWLTPSHRDWAYTYLASTATSGTQRVAQSPGTTLQGAQHNAVPAGSVLARVLLAFSAVFIVLGTVGYLWSTMVLEGSSYGTLTPFVSMFNSGYASQMQQLNSVRSLSLWLGTLGVILFVTGVTILITRRSTSAVVSSGASLVRCPYCAELIQPAAAKCRYCGSGIPAP